MREERNKAARKVRTTRKQGFLSVVKADVLSSNLPATKALVSSGTTLQAVRELLD